MLTPIAERDRITQHLLHAERVTAEADVSALDPVRALTRQLLLEELGRYRAEGRFPKNPGNVPDFTPTFVDAEGTPCAMAHLLEIGGQHELVEKIARERNYARVHELADEPLLLEWLDAAGLTVEEAATIQPGYSCTTPASCVCGKSGWQTHQLPVPAKAVLQAVVLPNSALQVEKVYGQTALVVGDKLTYAGEAKEGSKLLIGLSDSQATQIAGSSADQLASVVLDSNEKFACSAVWTSGSAPGLTTEEWSKLAFAPDCLTEAYKLSGYESRTCSSGRGCSNAPADPFSLGILLAIAGVLMRRRLAK